MRQRPILSRLIYRIAFAALSAAMVFPTLAAPPIHAQTKHNTGVIDGVVVGPDSKPVVGARVFLQPSDGQVPRVAQTDSQGYFRFHALRQDLYDVRAQKNGRTSDWTRNVNLKSGAQATVNLKLNLARPASVAPQE